MSRLRSEDKITDSFSPAKRRLLEKYLRGQMESRSATQAIPPRTPGEPIPLSYAQEQVWLHAQMAPGLPLYNEPVTIHHSGPLDVAVLEQSFNEILRRHEAWRTCIDTVDGQPVQVVQPNLVISLPVVDLRGFPKEQREAKAVRIAAEDARSPIDLARVPLFRARLIRLDDEEHRLYLTLSHIIFDGVALYQVFLPELVALYDAFAAGKASPLPVLSIQYPDYACWQRRCMREEALADDAAYWRRQLAGDLPALYLPVDRPSTWPQTFRGSMVRFSLSGSLTKALRTFSQAEGSSVFHTLLAGFGALLHRYSGEAVIPIGSVTAGRSHPATQLLLGYFLNTVVLRADLSGNPDFRELVKRARNVTIEALEHDRLPFEHLVRELRIRRDPSHNPIFQALFSLEPPLPELNPAWRLTQMDIDTGATKYDLYLELDERSDAILARFHYSTDLFDAATLVRMAEHWQTLLEGALADPGRRLSDLPVLSPGERRQMVVGWNDTGRPDPHACLHELFEAQAERSPDAVAVVFGTSQLTYRELNERANQLAWHLRKLGVGPEIPVGLCVERSPDMVIGLLGTLKAGGAYIPLDPTFPEKRLAFMFSDANPRVLVTQERLRRRLPRVGHIVLLDADWKAIGEESRSNPGTRASPENLAYVMYTSGSTGKPKGVLIEHRSIVNLLYSMQRTPGLSRDDVLVAVTTLSFDIAGLEIYLPLIAGARLVIASSDVAGDGTLLLELLRQSGATVMQATPVTWRLLVQAGWEGSPPLKVLCGGEALTPELGRELTRRSTSVWNLYGPTETTIWSSVYRLSGGEKGGVPIGRPVANTQLYVLDPHRNPVPINVAGEIHIAGNGVARGYLNRPEMTAERFIPDPFDDKPEARLYKTGDLARYLTDGNIEYVGRLDHQIKVRGFRIELGEIEAVLRQHPAVREVVVIAREDIPGDKRLVAYVVPAQKPAPAIGELRGFIKKRLPGYMIPGQFTLLETLPLTPNGKVDRGKLSITEKAHSERGVDYIEPATLLERQLVQIWENLLEIRPIGTRDNFFDLGGHSLLAVKLMIAIERAVGRRLPISTLFAGATIEHLAQAFLQQPVETSWFPVTPIRENGSRVPFFFLHGDLDGGGLYCLNVAEVLGREQPFVALHPHGVDGRPVPASIEAMAIDHLATVRSLQPHGPYLLGGFCIGGVVALEMARRLRAESEGVALLAVMDASIENTWFGAAVLRGLVDRFGALWGLTPHERLRLYVRVRGILGLVELGRHYKRRLIDLSGSDLDAWVAVLRRKTRRSREKFVRALLRRQKHVAALDASPLSPETLGPDESSSEMRATYRRVLAGYIPRWYAGTITLVRTGDSSTGTLDGRWRAVARKVDVHVIPGDHTTSRTQHVRVFGERLSACLQKAQQQ